MVTVPAGLDGNNIYAGGLSRIGAFLLKVVERGFLQLGLFSCVDAGGASAETVVSSESDFNKDDAVCLLHDQINFAPATMVIALYQFEAGGLQVLQGGVFTCLSGFLFTRSCHWGLAAESCRLASRSSVARQGCSQKRRLSGCRTGIRPRRAGDECGAHW